MYSDENEKKTISVFGIFYDRKAMEQAVEDLKSAGFRGSDMSTLEVNEDGVLDPVLQNASKTLEFALVGLAFGAVIGAIWGWLAGKGIIGIPVMGPLAMEGPFWSAFVTSHTLGFVGGVAGGAIGITIPEYGPEQNATFVKKGSIILAVHMSDPEGIERARDVFKNCEARNIRSVIHQKRPAAFRKSA